MGGKESKHHHHKSESPAAENQESGEAKTTTKTEAAASPSPQPAAAQSPPPDKVDVMILSTNLNKDLALAKLIKERLEESSIPVYLHSQESEAKLAGKLIVDAKCIVYIASEDAAKNNVGQDLISLAYISNKSISVVAETPKEALMKSFVVGMRMTLYQTKWVIFDVDPTPQLSDYISELQGMVGSTSEEAPTSPMASIDQSSLIVRRGGRLNTKLRAQTTVPDFAVGNQQQINTFWERNFPNEEEVPWYKFQKCFLDNYEAQLSKLLTEDNIPWLLKMLKDDVFEGKEKITKADFMHVRGESEEHNAFWKVVSQIAVEKFNMKEVFNMNSSVRLAAIEKLAAFQNPAVIEALMTLLEDMDPNVRAVAAICLGRTGCTEEKVVDKLIGLLKDGDRIVRQSACLSLGSMKAVKAIPHIGNIWRNDFISVVRNAARTALENMNIPEAKEVLSVTKVLEDEIEALAGNQAAV